MMDSARTQSVARHRQRTFAIAVMATVVAVLSSWNAAVRADAAPVAAEAVSAGSDFTCAVVSGAAKCWGRNDNGEIGNGTFAISATEGHALVPVQVTGLTSGVSAISAGDGFACAIVGGAAMCWGKNDSGQLGNGTQTVSATPVQVTGLTSGVTAISAGYGHACAVVSGAAKCWGSQSSFFGALGNGVDADTDGDYDDSNVPVQVSGLTSGVTAISANLTNSCAVQSGAAKCWGSQFWGQLGNGVDASGGGIISSPTPVQVTGLTSNVSVLTSGYEYTCALVSDAASCWGYNNNGQLGDAWETNAATTALQPIGLEADVTDIDASTLHTCAIVSGAAKCWGRNYRGQLGDGTQAPHYAAADVNGLTSGVTDVSTGWNHSCAIANGLVWCWGGDWYGEVGDGLGEYERDVLEPVQVVDTIPPPPPAPTITIQSPLQGQVLTSPNVAVQFVVSGHPSATTQCQLDEAEWVDCASPWNIGGLAGGAHVARIYAGDMFGGESTVEISFSVGLPTPPAGGGLPQSPSPPVPAKLPRSIKYSKGITLHATCPNGCEIRLSLKLGSKKIKLPSIRVAAGSTSRPIKVKLSKKTKKQIKAALKAKKKVSLTVVTSSSAGSAEPETVRLK